jgi:hypothetical protein
MPAAICGSRRVCHTPERRVGTIAGIEGRLDAYPIECGQGEDCTSLPELNNDHVLDPDGEHISMSAMDGTSIAAPSRAARWIGSHLMTAIGTISMVCRRTDPGLPTSRSATSPILEDSP